MRRVIMESPYSGDVEKNVRYARACIRDCLGRGEAPIASHLLFTQPGVLDDTVAEERRRGMEAGWAWMDVCEAVVVYTDLGITNGMNDGISVARSKGKSVEFREIKETGW